MHVVIKLHPHIGIVRKMTTKKSQWYLFIWLKQRSQSNACHVV
jgi:hypothetical protein